MKRIVQLLLSCSLVLSLCGGVSAEETEEEKQEILSEETAETEASTENVPNKECEWNVMIYLCGTDLESKEGLATQNLKAIADTLPSDEVNLLVQTGGAKAWDPAEKLGFDIANDRLQRWSYGDDGFVLMDEVEDASMADGRTLTDFIQWTADHYSAKKNMLVLWDHGGGSSTGLILDENYGDTIMPVFVLEEALQESGTHFDPTVVEAFQKAKDQITAVAHEFNEHPLSSEIDDVPLAGTRIPVRPELEDGYLAGIRQASILSIKTTQ